MTEARKNVNGRRRITGEEEMGKTKYIDIDVLKERLQANGYSNAALVSELNRCIGYLMRLPSAHRGLWEQVGDNAYRCSVCGEISCCKSLFCADCGSRMDGEKE